jgi:hypothetical protein
MEGFVLSRKLRRLENFGRRLNRPYDVRIRCAAAQIPGQIMTNVVCRWLWVAFKKFLRHQNETRGAKTALERAVLNKRLLDRMKLIAAGESLDRYNFTSIDKGSKIQAAANGQAIHQRRATATESLPATFSSAEQTEITT